MEVIAVDSTRRQFLRWCGLSAMGGLSLNLWGCGAKALTGNLLHAAAAGGAKPPALPKAFLLRNDLQADPRAMVAMNSRDRLISLAQLSDIHITLDDSTLTSYPKLESLLDGFGDAIEYGGLGKNARASYSSAKGERFDGSGTKQDRNVELLFQMPSMGQ